MAELAGERRFGKEGLVHHALGLGAQVFRELEHLDRDLPVGERIVREVHPAGGAAADLTKDRVFAQVLLELELHRHVQPSLSQDSAPEKRKLVGPHSNPASWESGEGLFSGAALPESGEDFSSGRIWFSGRS